MKYLPLILVLISSNVFGQETAPSKEKTQTWLKSVIHTYGSGELKFENDKIIYDDPYDATGFHLNHEAMIKSLCGLKISSGTKGYTAIYLSCLEGNCVKVGTKLQGNTGDLDYSEGNKFMIQLRELPEDFKERLITAFNRLIVLYGGNVIDDTF